MTVVTPNAGDSIRDSWTVGVSNAVNRTPAGVNANACTSGTDTTTSATYVNLAGTGAQTSFNFTKVETATRIMVTMHASFTAVTANALPRFGVRINGVDYDVVQAAPSGVGDTTTASGIAFVTGVAAGTYTVQGRWKRQAGSGTPTRTADNNWLTIVCEEVN